MVGEFDEGYEVVLEKKFKSDIKYEYSGQSHGGGYWWRCIGRWRWRRNQTLGMTTSKRGMGKVVEGVFEDPWKEKMDYTVVVLGGCGVGG